MFLDWALRRKEKKETLTAEEIERVINSKDTPVCRAVNVDEELIRYFHGKYGLGNKQEVTNDTPRTGNYNENYPILR